MGGGGGPFVICPKSNGTGHAPLLLLVSHPRDTVLLLSQCPRYITALVHRMILDDLDSCILATPGSCAAPWHSACLFDPASSSVPSWLSVCAYLKQLIRDHSIPKICGVAPYSIC